MPFMELSWKSHGILFYTFRGNPVFCYDSHMIFYNIFSLEKFLPLVIKQVLINNLLALTRENWSTGFPTMSDTNQDVQAQKINRDWKFWI